MITLLAAIVFVCMIGEMSYARVITPELEAVLGSLPAGEDIPVIVTLKERADHQSMSVRMKGASRQQQRQKLVETLRGLAETSQAHLKALLDSRGVKNLRSLWIMNGMAFSAPASIIREVAGQPEVDLISPDHTLSVPPVTPGMATSSEWNIDAVRAPVLWNSGYTGQGIVVAGMDTGVDVQHPDLAASWRGGADSWFDPNNEHATPADIDGHCTMTMGLMVGGSAGGTNIGVAPGAKWIAVKIFNDAGVASASVIHQGFQWLLDPDNNPATDDAPDVVNNSWSLDGSINKCTTEFEPDVTSLRAAGIAVVFAAGNSGPYPSSSVSPANYSESVAAGAIDEKFAIAAFSSRGPSACDSTIYPELVAPGVNIRTSDLTFGGVFPDSYVYVSGTSFSAPHIAGTMALLLSAFPGLTLAQMEGALKTTAAELGPLGPDNTYGYGLVDVLASFTALGGVPAETVSPPAAPAGPRKAQRDTAYAFSTGGAASSLGDQLEYLFDWGDGTDSGWLAPGIVSVSKSWASPGTFAVRTRARCAVHPLVVSGWSETLTVKVSIPVTVMVTSNGAYDGWVLESAQGSGVGGSVGYGRIRVGDNAGNRQRKGILFFNTVKIPAGAEIISATLKVTLRHVVGTNPFTTLGTFYADVMKGTFNQKRLQKGDFQVSATAAQAAVMSDPLGNGSISTGSLNGDGINAINKGGITQVRVYFSQPTDGNMTTDAIVFRSGEAYDRANRPALEITYLP